MMKAEHAYPLILTEYPDILTAEQTAKILGIGRHQVYKMIDRLFGLKLSGSCQMEMQHFLC
ncbi:MAG: hypothetical protein RRY64_10490 [Oscillospiraceae bacterium]